MDKELSFVTVLTRTDTTPSYVIKTIPIMWTTNDMHKPNWKDIRKQMLANVVALCNMGFDEAEQHTHNPLLVADEK
jgi:hypothetical protein